MLYLCTIHVVSNLILANDMIQDHICPLSERGIRVEEIAHGGETLGEPGSTENESVADSLWR
jgi:hypothetical protein